MLSALDNKGKRVHAWDAIREVDHVCPDCDERMILKRGSVTVAHFAHYAKSDCKHEGQSQEHMRMKYNLIKQFGKRYNMKLEIKIGNNRRADIVILDQKLVIECQVSPISIDEIMARNGDYESCGYSVMWIFHCSRINHTHLSKELHWAVRIPQEIRDYEENEGYFYVMDDSGKIQMCKLEYKWSERSKWSDPGYCKTIAYVKFKNSFD